MKELLEKGRKERAEIRLQLEQWEARTRQLMQAQQVPAAEVGDKLQSEVEDTGRRGVWNVLCVGHARRWWGCWCIRRGAMRRWGG